MVAAREVILITGAAGFLGQGLSRHCAALGFEVVGVDVITPDDCTSFKSFYRVALLEDELGKILEEFRPAYLVNLAGSADVRRSFVDPRDDFQRATHLFGSILDIVRRLSNETKVLFASSAAVYGQPKLLPIAEDESPNPISPYGYHKWMCELMALEYARIYGVKTASMRIFSAYGDGLKKQILWDICCKCRDGGMIELGGDGSETRDFIHRRDVSAAALCILQRGYFYGEVYNVASGEDVSIATLARSIVAGFGIAEERLRFSGESRTGDPKNWRADISRLKSLGFDTTVSLSQGITEYVKWFKNLL